MKIGFNSSQNINTQNKSNVGFSGYFVHARAKQISNISDELEYARNLYGRMKSANSQGATALEGRRTASEVREKVIDSAKEALDWILWKDALFTHVVKKLTGGKEGKEGSEILNNLVAKEKEKSGIVNEKLEKPLFKAIGSEESFHRGDFLISDLSNLADYFSVQKK